MTIQEAAQEYINRQNRGTRPNGNTDNGGRWYPSKEERCDCCDCIREPSRAYPWSLMAHCRTARHVANLFGVNWKDLTNEARRIRRN